jgi:hypothetical protein
MRPRRYRSSRDAAVGRLAEAALLEGSASHRPGPWYPNRPAVRRHEPLYVPLVTYQRAGRTGQYTGSRGSATRSGRTCGSRRSRVQAVTAASAGWGRPAARQGPSRRATAVASGESVGTVRPRRRGRRLEVGLGASDDGDDTAAEVLGDDVLAAPCSPPMQPVQRQRKRTTAARSGRAATARPGRAGVGGSRPTSLARPTGPTAPAPEIRRIAAGSTRSSREICRPSPIAQGHA